MRVRKVAVRMFAVNRPALAIWTGKLGSEDDVKEEFKEERDPPATHEEGSFLVYSLLHWSLNVFFLFCPILFRSFWRAHLKKKKSWARVRRASLFFWNVLPFWHATLAPLTLVICVSFSKVWVPVWLARILRGMDRRTLLLCSKTPTWPC